MFLYHGIIAYFPVFMMVCYKTGPDAILLYAINSYWASEASPTLGCSIEISGDIYVGMYVGMSVVCQINCVVGITWTKHVHAQS